MNDPYQPIEKKLNMTGRALEIISRWDMPVHIITKSNIVLRDIKLLKKIGKVYSAVTFTVTAADDDLSKKIEPFAPASSERLKALGVLSSSGILTGITLMPVLPFITDSEENIIGIVDIAKEYGAKYIIPAFGMTLRDRQRDYYYNKLDLLFPGLKEKYIRKYKNYYSAGAPNYEKLSKLFYEKCADYGILTKIPKFKAGTLVQLSLFEN